MEFNQLIVIIITVVVSGIVQSVMTVIGVKTDVRWLIKRTDLHEQQISALQKERRS